MKFKVYHADSQETRFQEDPALWRERHEEYKLVATVTCDDKGQVFERTNHIDSNWLENPGVEAHVESARSTSVGDVIISEDGSATMIAALGFKDMGGKFPAFTATTTYNPGRIADLLCTGFEGGMTRCWATIASYDAPLIVAQPEGWEDEIYKTYQFPISEGGAVYLQEVGDEGVEQDEDGYWLDDNGERLPIHKLDAVSIQKGLDLMATIAPRHFADWVKQNDDAITGDVFIQLCCLGEIRYG